MYPVPLRIASEITSPSGARLFGPHALRGKFLFCSESGQAKADLEPKEKMKKS
jgi:hypothetical protein